LCWDGSVFYYVDSPTKQIKKYSYNEEDLTITGADVVYTVVDDDVYPDGMCIDDEGKLWLALWNGYKVLRIDPVSGEVLQIVDVPCKKVISCCFGGVDRDMLFITTASLDMSEIDSLKYPDSGKIFFCRPGVKGPLLKQFLSK
jgi:sugar lactone lactonase YvrE